MNEQVTNPEHDAVQAYLSGGDDAPVEEVAETTVETNEAQEPTDEDDVQEAPDETDGEPSGEEEAKEESEEGDEADPNEETFTVKVNGEEFDVGLTELLSGYQRQRDYTQSKMALADERRAFDQERQQAVGELTQALQYYAIPKVQQPQLQDFQGHQDPNGAFAQAYTQWQAQEQQRTQAQADLDQILAYENAQAFERRDKALLEAIPEWSDQSILNKEVAEMQEIAKARYGIDPQEIINSQDARTILVLRDAVKAAKIEAKPVIVNRKTQEKTKSSTATPEAPKARQNRAAMGTLAKTGSLEDALSIDFD